MNIYAAMMIFSVKLRNGLALCMVSRHILQMEDENHDDVDMPSSAIVSDTLGVAVCEINWHAEHCVLHTRKDLDHHGLVATTEEENIWAWNDGEKWGDELPEVAKEENWFYLPMWHTFSGSYQPSVTCDHLMN